jgi:hypothetical protein
MKKIIDYVLVIQDSPENIEERVKCRIIDGWQPQGGVVVLVEESFTEIKVVFYQAMVKFEK